jgi:hypothetical protein
MVGPRIAAASWIVLGLGCGAPQPPPPPSDLMWWDWIPLCRASGADAGRTLGERTTALLELQEVMYSGVAWYRCFYREDGGIVCEGGAPPWREGCEADDLEDTIEEVGLSLRDLAPGCYSTGVFMAHGPTHTLTLRVNGAERTYVVTTGLDPREARAAPPSLSAAIQQLNALRCTP